MDQFPFSPVQTAHPYYGLEHLILPQGQKYAIRHQAGQ